jgi:hypothetical protein
MENAKSNAVAIDMKIDPITTMSALQRRQEYAKKVKQTITPIVTKSSIPSSTLSNRSHHSSTSKTPINLSSSISKGYA